MTNKELGIDKLSSLAGLCILLTQKATVTLQLAAEVHSIIGCVGKQKNKMRKKQGYVLVVTTRDNAKYVSVSISYE